MDVREGGCVFSPIGQSLGPFLKYVSPKALGAGACKADRAHLARKLPVASPKSICSD